MPTTLGMTIMFIKRLHKYAVKKLATGAARIYMQNTDALRKAGLPENTAINITYSKHRIVVTASKNGTNKIMDTGRGPLLELKNKSVANAMGDLTVVTITVRKGVVIFSVHYADKQRMEREQSFFNALVQGKPLRTGSFFSGLGMLSYHIKQGLRKAGIDTQMVFANDSCEIAMECNLAGNPIWDNCAEDAFVQVDTLANIDLSLLPQMDFLEIGYPCVGQSSLCKMESRDLNHPIVGTVFVKLLAAIEKINPAIVLIENTPGIMKSETLRIIQREMPGYRFESVIVNGHEYGEIEARKRACIVAVSNGLPELNLSNLKPPANPKRNILSDFMENIPANSPLFRTMDHLKRKDADPSLNFKNKVYTGSESLIATLTAGYAAPRAGSPMIAHPTNPEKQRQVTEKEHGLIRRLPRSLFDQVMMIADGSSPLVNKTGSKAAAHRLLGNGVSKFVWDAVGEFLGGYFNQCIPSN